MRRSITSLPGGTHAQDCVSMGFSLETSTLLRRLVHNRNSSSSNPRNRIPLCKMQSLLRQMKTSPA